MASSGGTLPNFSNQYITTSFTDLLSGENNNNKEEEDQPIINNQDNFWGIHHSDQKRVEIPKYKSFPPSTLPLSPPPLSPSSYLSFPHSLSPSIFLDSPLLYSESKVLPSPTTGTFAGDLYNSSKEDTKLFSDFSFQSQTRPSDDTSSVLSNFAGGRNSTDSFVKKQEFSTTQTTTQPLPMHHQYAPPSQLYIRDQRKSEDGYNWRKYGEKQVKGSQNPRSYYKCTFPNCPTKKIVEKNSDGHVTEIVYKGSHNHQKPESTRRSSSNSVQNPIYNDLGIPNQSNSSVENAKMESVATPPENSSASFGGGDDFDHGSSMSNSRDEDENEPEAKKWKGDNESEGISASGSRTVREPRIVVQTTSDIDILDDGYRWRKYGQKVVRGNPNPRSYYKCTSTGCPVRKHVERASQDLRSVITTYEGKHNHDVPAARGSANYNTINRNNNNKNVPTQTTTMRPSAMNILSNGTNFSNQNRMQTFQNQTPYTLQMLHETDRFAYSSGGYVNQNAMSVAKEEPREESFFDSFLNN